MKLATLKEGGRDGTLVVVPGPRGLRLGAAGGADPAGGARRLAKL